MIKGPHVNVWHMGLFKSFSLTESVRLRWELTATNFFNHPNYNNPATNISQAGERRSDHWSRRASTELRPAISPARELSELACGWSGSEAGLTEASQSPTRTCPLGPVSC